MARREHNVERLRIDFIKDEEAGIIANGKIALSSLPGRKDLNRDLEEDIATIKEKGIKNIVCLLSENEFSLYGVPELRNIYDVHGFDVYLLSIPDHSVTTKEQMICAINWIKSRADLDQIVLVHCVAGLGRSGMLAACFHKVFSGLNSKNTIRLIRACRGLQAIETCEQEQFVVEFNGNQ